jgi:hypothetical protein
VCSTAAAGARDGSEAVETLQKGAPQRGRRRPFPATAALAPAEDRRARRAPSQGRYRWRLQASGPRIAWYVPNGTSGEFQNATASLGPQTQATTPGNRFQLPKKSAVDTSGTSVDPPIPEGNAAAPKTSALCANSFRGHLQQVRNSAGILKNCPVQDSRFWPAREHSRTVSRLLLAATHSTCAHAPSTA